MTSSFFSAPGPSCTGAERRLGRGTTTRLTHHPRQAQGLPRPRTSATLPQTTKRPQHHRPRRLRPPQHRGNHHRHIVQLSIAPRVLPLGRRWCRMKSKPKPEHRARYVVALYDFTAQVRPISFPPPPSRLSSLRLIPRFSLSCLGLPFHFPQADGNLSFRTGDRIEIVERTASTEDWWTGWLRGQQGVFPGMSPSSCFCLLFLRRGTHFMAP